MNGLALRPLALAVLMTLSPLTGAAPLLQHDSRDLRDKAPFGAVPTGTTVQFALKAPADATSVTLVIERRRLEGNQDLIEYTEVARETLHAAPDGRWQASHRFDAPAVYGYWFEVRTGDTAWLVQNNDDAVPWTKEHGSNGLGQSVAMPADTKAIRRFRHTVYARDFTVPAWSADAVYYYVFPERYRNGDRRNDPKPGVDTYQDHGVEFHANWLDKPYKPNSGDGSDAVYNNDFFGGDIAGIIEKLDDIAALGANALYITPLLTAPSNHKYDTADYRHIDPHFGSDADFERLCREAAKRGIRVIPDTSLNHVGSDSRYFDRYGKHASQGAFEGGVVRPSSPYADWFRFKPGEHGDKAYQGWLDIPDLPELDKSSRSFREFAYGRDGVMQLWLDRGASGWRMDVAPWVPDDFWREWRSAIKRRKPDAITIAETWFEASKFFLGDTFDSTMNYLFRDAALAFAKGGDARASVRTLELMRELYPPQAMNATMNLLSSHDVPRALHVLGEDKRRFLLASFLQMTWPGAPAIYYGDEVGVSGGEDPYNRATYPWPDLGGHPDIALQAEVKRLVAMRRANPVLRHGSLQAPVVLDEHVVAWVRRLGDDWAVVAANNADFPVEIDVPVPADAPKRWSDVHVREGRLHLLLPSLAGVALFAR